MLDKLERQWHTAAVCSAVAGDGVDDWAAVHERFDLYLLGDAVPLTKDQEQLQLLGFK